MSHRFRPHLLALLLLPVPASAQQARLVSAAPVDIPFPVDGNSPLLWRNGQISLFTSTGQPWLAEGPNIFTLSYPLPVYVDSAGWQPVWIEGVWTDRDGLVLAWYHQEPRGLCPGTGLTAPRIGALLSRDGGRSFTDLGIILTSGAPVDCRAKNDFFGGGNGDFSVVFDERTGYFYFLFTHYGGDLSEQGVAIARLAYQDRLRPVGAVRKYYQGAWNEPGLGGRLTPVFPARRPWQGSEPDSFWGPALHWNHHLNTWVVLMNRACCTSEWKQEGVYVSFNEDLARPDRWSQPRQLLPGDAIGYRPGFYPQVIGLAEGETDTFVGSRGRLFIHGRSRWEIVFDHAAGKDGLVVGPSAGPVSPEVEVSWSAQEPQ